MKNVKASKKSEFRAVRPNTLRAQYLANMDGTKTLPEIATAMRTSNNNARVTIHCLKRDCGIGHTLSSDGKITAALPKGVQTAVQILPVQPTVDADPPLPNSEPASSNDDDVVPQLQEAA